MIQGRSEKDKMLAGELYRAKDPNLAADHPREPQQRRDGLESAKLVSVGANVWIGGGAILCPGVNVGDDAIIGAGSVVTRDVPAGVVAAGNPCRVMRKL